MTASFILVVPLYPPNARRLFTLEYAWDIVDRHTYNVLGAWTKDGHHNLGEGPPTDGEAFAAAIARIL